MCFLDTYEKFRNQLPTPLDQLLESFIYEQVNQIDCKGD